MLYLMNSMIHYIVSGLLIFMHLHCVMSNYYVLHLYAISLSLKDPPKTWPPQKVVVKFYTSVIAVCHKQIAKKKSEVNQSLS